MKSKKEARNRPSKDQPNVGNGRREIIKAAIDQFDKAFKDGYYIECISLIESLIADRLESLSNQLHNSNYSDYQPLGTTIFDIFKAKGKLDSDLIDIIDRINIWKDKRNEAIHEMGKLLPDLAKTFDKRYGNLKEYAKEGKKLFRDLDKAIRRWRTKVKNGTITLKE